MQILVCPQFRNFHGVGHKFVGKKRQYGRRGVHQPSDQRGMVPVLKPFREYGVSKKRPHVATYLKLGYNYTSYGEIYNEVIWQQWSGWTNVEVRRQYDLQSIRLSFGLYFD